MIERSFYLSRYAESLIVDERKKGIAAAGEQGSKGTTCIYLLYKV